MPHSARPLLGLFLYLSLACDSQSTQKNTVEIPSAPQSPQSEDQIPGTESPTTAPDGESPIEQPAPIFPQDRSISPSEMLRDFGQNLLTRSEAFVQATAELEQSGLAYCNASTPETQSAAQAAWEEVMRQWQYFELFQVGPIAANAKVLKYSIYAWPDPANYCKIDEEALQRVTDPSRPLPPNYNRKGLQAIEYLLFETSLQSRCDAASPVATTWNQQTPEAKLGSRCAYLKPLLADLRSQAALLRTAWGTSENNPLAPASGVLPLNEYQALFDNVFYLDLELKNRKLAAPAGHDVNHCPNSPQPCLDRKEFKFASFSRQAIDANLEAFTDLMFGAGERRGGFTALLRGAGRDDLADRSEVIATRIAQLNETKKDLSLDELITEQAAENCELSSQSWLCQLRVNIKAISSEMKREYAQILQLKLPEGPQGDND